MVEGPGDGIGAARAPCAYNAGQYDQTDRELALFRGLYWGELAYVDDALSVPARGAASRG